MIEKLLLPNSDAILIADTDMVMRNAGTSVDSDLTAQHRTFLAAATSDNTRRAYRSAVRHFLAWGGALPSDEASMIRYLLLYAQSLNPRTLALRLTALSQWHIHQGFADPASTPDPQDTGRHRARVWQTEKEGEGATAGRPGAHRRAPGQFGCAKSQA